MKNKYRYRYILITAIVAIFVVLTFFGISMLTKLKGTVSDIVINDNDGYVSLKISESEQDENGYINWNFSDTKKVEVSVDFKDTNIQKSNKKIKITLDEGMMYRTYPVTNDSYDALNSKYEHIIASEDNLSGAIKGITKPTYETYKGTTIKEDNSIYGDLIYEISDNINQITIPLNIKVDEIKLYKNKPIENFIKVEVIDDSGTLSSVSANLNIINYTYGMYCSSLNNVNSSPNVYYKQGSRYYTYQYSYRRNNDNASIYFKKLKYEIYYPEQMSFVNVITYDKRILAVSDTEKNNGEYIYFPSNQLNITNDVNNHKVIITAEGNFSGLYALYFYGFSLLLEVKEDISNTQVLSNIPNANIIMTRYDGESDEKCTIETPDVNVKGVGYANKNLLDIEVLDQNDPTTRIYDDNNENTYVYGPVFRISNNNIYIGDNNTEGLNNTGVLNNQLITLTTDSNFNAIGAVFPHEVNATGAVQNVQYKLTTDSEESAWRNWDDTLGTREETNSYTKYVLNDGYISKIRAVVDGYDVNYKASGSSPKAGANLNLIGTLTSNNINNAVITANICNTATNECSNTITNTIYRESSDNISYSNTGSTTVLFKTIGDNPISTNNFNVGDKFKTEATLKAHTYPYGTRTYVENADVYLRQPQGITIDQDTIQITNEKGEPVSYTKRVYNRNNDVIIILDTEEEIGHYFGRNLQSKNMTVSFESTINYDIRVAAIDINELVSWGSDIGFAYSKAPYNLVDIYDMNNNGITVNDDPKKSEYILPVTREGASTLAILPMKSVVVKDKITSFNKTLQEYEGTEETINDIYDNDELEYGFQIVNRTDGIVNAFEYYFPIPKAGLNYGNKFQNGNFEYDFIFKSIGNIDSKFKVEYSTGRGNYENMTFTSTMPSDKSKITMVKISLKSNEELGSFESHNISITMKAKYKNEENILNQFRSVYRFTTPQLTGLYYGDKYALRINKSVIEGTAFIDKNANGIYDDGDLVGLNLSVDMYKVTDDGLEPYTGTRIIYDKNSGYFYVENSSKVKDGAYVLFFNTPKGYQPVDNSDISNSGWYVIPSGDNINVSAGFETSKLSFSVDDIIIGINKPETVTLKNIKPNNFDSIKNQTKAYEWKLVNASDSTYVSFTDNNTNSISVKGLQAKDNVRVEVTIKDMFDNVITKIFNIKIKESVAPIINADDVVINVGEEINFTKYIKSAIDYKENEIELVYSGDNKNVTYTTNVKQVAGVAIQKGDYEIEYTVKDSYNNIGTKKIKLTVLETKGAINPSTGDNIRMIIVILLAVAVINVILRKLVLKK